MSARPKTCSRPTRARRGIRRPLTLLALLAVLALSLPLSTSAAEVEDNCASTSNPIVCENALPGEPRSDWQVKGVGDPTIQGYATSMSVNVGQTESFKIDTPSTAYHIDILRLGYYGGDGARLIASGIQPTAQLPQTQPECLHESSTGLIDCGDWGVSASWTVPSNAVSGVYIAHLVRDDAPSEGSQIIFVVRNDSSHSEILLQTSDATWEAYNDYGGNSLYSCTVDCPPGEPEGYKAAYAVSYNRPFDGSFTTDDGKSYLYYAEYQMMYWLEENGYDVSYTTESEVANNGALLKNHKVFISSGHDEYWSSGQRESVEAALAAGVNLAFFSGNEMFWKTRWANSTEGSNTPYRTLITYKETHFKGPVDPDDPSTWTGAWSDPRGSPPADGGRPANALTGQYFLVNSGTGDITVPSQYSKLRVWRNTQVASLQPGQTLTLAPGSGTLGYEWDLDLDNGFRPAGEFDMSSTTLSGLQKFGDYGTNLEARASEPGEPGAEEQGNTSSATHHLTLYRAPSGGLVFGAGTVQWSWGLANVNAWGESATEPSGNPPDPNMEQFTVNLLAEMGAQPGSPLEGLDPASQSTDTTPPSSTITSPEQGETLQDGSQVTITGTASDAGGGVVAGVEVSTDNGATWHPATLTTPAEQSVKWSYTWAAHGYPTTTIKSRAVDDSANLETPSAGVSVNVSCPCSIWGAAVTPPVADWGDPNSAELGMKFTSEVFGTVTGVRFYKSAANTGTHIGSLWSASGQLLAQATFGGETASGWQQVNFSTPVEIFADTTYVVSYFDPSGHYAASPYYFYTPPPTGGHIMNSPPLNAVSASAEPVDGVFVSANGLGSYSSTSTFPTTSYEGTNYWVDPVFMPATTAPGQVTNLRATAGVSSAILNWSAPSSGGPVTTYTITPYIGSEAQPSTTVTGTPPASSATVSGLEDGATYTFTVQASNPNGPGPVSEPSSAITPAAMVAPSAPTAVTAGAATHQALVSWSAPSSEGGSPITSYKVTPYVGATAQSTIEVSPNATSTVVRGLANGIPYTFAVTASNAIGEGPPSSASNAVTPQDTIFDFATPAKIDSGDARSSELGVKFSSEVPGSVTGIRFYKAAANTGTHTGSLWSASGTLLATATFTNESATGWQRVNFSTPVAIIPNTTYIAAYLAPNGHYSDTSKGFATTSATNPPLTAPANTITPNGVGAYTTTSTFPTTTYNATNYWVDVDFEPAPAVVTEAASAITQATASLNATVNPNGGTVSECELEYGTTETYGSSAPCTPSPGSGESPVAVSAPLTGLTANTTYHFRISATSAGGTSYGADRTLTTPPDAPTLETTPATTITQTTATLNATVNPNGGEVSECTLEYGTATVYELTKSYESSVPCTPTPGSGENPVAVSAPLTGLTANTTYHFRVTATNAGGTNHSEDETLTTLPNAPTLQTTPASAITQTTATLNATINPNGGTVTECELEYGATETYGSNAPCTPTPGSGESPVAISAQLTGLTAKTTYHFRVTASNAGGTSKSSDETFKTPANAPTVTSIEPASGPTAGNASVRITGTGFVAPATVTIGGQKLNEVVVASEEEITAKTPAATAGPGEVIVSDEYGASTKGPTYTYIAPPTLQTKPATTITQTTATLNATVNPNGGEVTECTLEYGTTETYESSAPCTPTPDSGENPVAVLAQLTGLTAKTTYHFRVTASNAGGTSKSSDETFKTPANAPTVTSIEPASGPTAGNASVRITGTGFVAPATVTIGGQKLNEVVVASEEEITAKTPAATAGPGEVVVSDEYGASKKGPTYTYIAPPTLQTKPATTITQTTATLNATINPNSGEVTECTLEYAAAAVYELTKSYESSVPCTPSPGSGENPVAVSAPLTGLTANTTYHFRVSATSAGGTGHGEDQTFTTLPDSPTLEARPASAIAHTTATLNATVNPNGGTVTACELEYGTTETYGSSAPCTPSPGSGESPVAVSAPLAGLTANTTYHFRVSATNAGGTSHSADETLVTHGAPEFGRCVKAPAEKEDKKTVYHGGFTAASCLVKSETSTGKYEWHPGVLQTHFTVQLTSGSVKLDSAVKASTVTCTGEAGTGEYTGLKTVGDVDITLTGCERSAEQCSSATRAGEIVLNTLEGTLGVVKLGVSSSKNTIGLYLRPTGNTGPVTEFTCGGSSVSVRGSVIVSVPADKMRPTLTLKAKASKGKQAPERFEGGPKTILEESFSGAPLEPVGLTATIAQTSEEEVEINSVV